MSGKENLVQVKANSFSGLANIRSRRERPCDACRRRKSRCVIHEGAVLCVLCEFHKQECTFVQDPQPRKRKVVVDDSKKDTTPKKRCVKTKTAMSFCCQLNVLTPFLRQNRSLEAVASAQKPKVATRPRIDLLQRTNSTSSSSGRQDQHHVLGETLGLQTSRHSRHIGLTSPFEPTLIGLSQFDSRNESILSIGTLRKVNEHETFIMYDDEDVHDYGDDAESFDAIEQIISPYGPNLIDLYFRIVHPSFPIIQKQVFLERFRSGERNFAPALLAGIYILALNWWSHDPKLANKPRPESSQLDIIASKSLSAAMQRPKLSTVQAGLLLLQLPEADSWSLTTQLVAIGQELGLHLDCSNWEIPLWERELRKRIAWALYMQDKWSSLIHGRPSHIFSANWAVPPMSEGETISEESQGNSNVVFETAEEREEIEKGRILFSLMISLTSIMAEIMDTFYTQTAIADFANAGKNSTRLILDRAKPVQIKLKEWFAKLPAVVRMDNVSAKKVSSTGQHWISLTTSCEIISN